MPTTDWWSSVAWEPFSSNQFPHPLGVRAEKGGLRVSYPGASLHATGKHAFASMQRDLLIGHSECAEFPDARVDGHDDVFVSVLFAKEDRRLRVTYGHGSPFVFVTVDEGSVAIDLDGKPSVFAGDAGGPTLGITLQGRHYGLFGPAGSTWSGLDGSRLVCRAGGRRYLSVAALPDARRETLALFARHAHSHVTDARVSWRYDARSGQVETEFRFGTTAFEGEETGTLFALYPHQWMASDTALLPLSYRSIRGPMRLAAGRSLRTSMRFPGVLPALPFRGAAGRERLRRQVREAAAKAFPDPGDTYWQGKALGTITGLIPVAEQSGEEDAAKELRAALKARLERWFTAPTDPRGGGAKKDQWFYQDRLWGALIGQRPSYGTSDALNDHHFHYGYFIHAAAEIARADPAWAAESRWGGMVSLLIRDIASPHRRDELFPFLRCFDPYAGHSWASGNARFGDGNNQESSSEAMNAWTGLILWGEATGDREIRDLGIWLYTTELHAIEAYWFDVEDELFPEGYDPTCAALIWGGKTDYATWFSGEPEHIHGIILLPVQSGSLYLGRRPEYVRRNIAYLAEQRGATEWKHWPEVFWCYEALADPGRARERYERGVGRLSVHDRPFVDHWIGSLEELGTPDRTVWADGPIAVAFTKEGRRSYVAYGLSKRAASVRFSDGTVLPVRPGRFATKR